MAILTATCEGTAGATATTSNISASPAMDGVTASITISNTRAAHGGSSLTTTAASQYAWWNTTAVTLMQRHYIYLDELPVVEIPLLVFRDGSTSAAQLLINVAGRARLTTTGSVVQATDTATFPVGQWVRCELYGSAGASTGAARAAIYIGDSSTPVWDSTLRSNINVAGTGGAFSAVRFNVHPGSNVDSLGLKTATDAVWDPTWTPAAPPVAGFSGAPVYRADLRASTGTGPLTFAATHLSGPNNVGTVYQPTPGLFYFVQDASTASVYRITITNSAGSATRDITVPSQAAPAADTLQRLTRTGGIWV